MNLCTLVSVPLGKPARHETKLSLDHDHRPAGTSTPSTRTFTWDLSMKRNVTAIVSPADFEPTAL